MLKSGQKWTHSKHRATVKKRRTHTAYCKSHRSRSAWISSLRDCFSFLFVMAKLVYILFLIDREKLKKITMNLNKKEEVENEVHWMIWVAPPILLLASLQQMIVVCHRDSVWRCKKTLLSQSPLQIILRCCGALTIRASSWRIVFIWMVLIKFETHLCNPNRW